MEVYQKLGSRYYNFVLSIAKTNSVGVQMSKPLKAALLSALVFPGSGHLYLKKHVQGVLLAGISTVCLFYLVSSVVKIAQDISDKILSGEVPADIVRISELILSQLENSVIHQVNISTSLLFICWLISIIDSYRQGRLDD